MFPYTLEELTAKVREYHVTRELKEGKFPGLSGLLITLDITDEQYDEAMQDEALAKVFVYARRRRQQWLEEKSLRDPKTAAACKLLMTQAENGSYGDKAPPKKQNKMEVVLRGAGYDEEKEKDDD